MIRINGEEVDVLGMTIAEYLQARGYRVEQVCCVDMFPNTVHVETIVALQRVDT